MVENALKDVGVTITTAYAITGNGKPMIDIKFIFKQDARTYLAIGETITSGVGGAPGIERYKIAEGKSLLELVEKLKAAQGTTWDSDAKPSGGRRRKTRHRKSRRHQRKTRRSRK